MITGTFVDLCEFAFLKQLFPQQNISVSYLKESRKWKCFLFQTTATSEFPYYILLYILSILFYIIYMKKKILYHNIACSVLGEKFQPGSGPGQFCKPTSTQVQYIDCQTDIEKKYRLLKLNIYKLYFQVSSTGIVFIADG